MTEHVLASKTFTDIDQEAFAQASGDFNPLHMDAIFARRTFNGSTTVHGVHLVLWALDQLARGATLGDVGRIRVRFSKPVAVGGTVLLRRESRGRGDVVVRLACNGQAVTTIHLSGSPGGRGEEPRPAPGPTIDGLASPRALAFEEMADQAGFVLFDAGTPHLERLFPSLVRQVGPDAAGTLSCLSRLVGMVCPGLYSIFSAIDLVRNEDVHRAGVDFRVVEADERFRRIVCQVVGPAFLGTIGAYSPLPARQQSCGDIRPHVVAGEFDGKRCLVVGGSRGLGEVVAKTIAMGGGEALITYAVGRSDAEDVARQIRAAGGRCSTLRLDVLQPIEPQFEAVAEPVDAVFYFATPLIFHKSDEFFRRDLLTLFETFYVDAFHRVCMSVVRRSTSGVVAFYPSSVFVEQRPRGMTEYAMAKAAGEILCAEMDRFVPGLTTVISRLPRMATDQTSSLVQVETAPTLDTLLPLVRRVLGPAPGVKAGPEASHL